MFSQYDMITKTKHHSFAFLSSNALKFAVPVPKPWVEAARQNSSSADFPFVNTSQDLRIAQSIYIIYLDCVWYFSIYILFYCILQSMLL